tara:strand:+ start:508 stop:1230 length:723 start_codon:yes stop_codon:yes gene_type:complete
MKLFDIDIGKGLSRALGIGEETLPTVAQATAAALTDNYLSAVQGYSKAIAQEKERKKMATGYGYPNPNMDQLRTYQKQGTDDLGGIIDIPASGTGVYEGYAGMVTQFGTQALRNILGQLGRRAGQVATGAGVGAGAAMMIDGNGNGCDPCQPKPFVRFNNCGQPIITRKMQKEAIRAVNCSGAELAAATLTGGDLMLLTMITSKVFPPQKRGITGQQMSTTKKTLRKFQSMNKQMKKLCK